MKGFKEIMSTLLWKWNQSLSTIVWSLIFYLIVNNFDTSADSTPITSFFYIQKVFTIPQEKLVHTFPNFVRSNEVENKLSVILCVHASLRGHPSVESPGIQSFYFPWREHQVTATVSYNDSQVSTEMYGASKSTGCPSGIGVTWQASSLVGDRQSGDVSPWSDFEATWFVTFGLETNSLLH